jgi:hypothetical protein
MKTLQHYCHKSSSSNETVSSAKDESQKQLTINMPTIASLVPATVAFAHLNDCCSDQCPVCIANSKLVPLVDSIKPKTNANKPMISSFTDNRLVEPNNELAFSNVNFILSNNDKPTKPNLFSSFSFTHSNEFFNHISTLNKSDSSVLKSKSINYSSNKNSYQSSQFQHQLSFKLHSDNNNYNTNHHHHHQSSSSHNENKQNISSKNVNKILI